MSFVRIIPIMHTLSPKADISIVFDEKYPIIAYIILDLELKYPLIAYIILGLKKVQNPFKADNRLSGSTNRIHFVLRSFVDMANSYDRAESCRKNIDNFVF